MTKTETYNNVTEALEALFGSTKIAKGVQYKLLDIIDENLKPKVSSSKYPPKLDKDGNIIEAWCRFHQQYEVAEDMVMSKGKSKGYCRASISLWNSTSKNIRDLEGSLGALIKERKFDEVAKISEQAEELKAKLNDPSSFDYDRDWKSFRAGQK